MSIGALSESHLLIDELEDALASGDGERRLQLLQRITDLFVAGSRRYSGDQIALFDDVLIRLCGDIELKARAKLARRLAGVDMAPAKIIRSLAFDDAIDVAGPVLTSSDQLTDADLVENASTKSQDHLYAISQRLKLSEVVTDVLVERGDRRVVRSVARNAGAKFSFAGYDKLTARARDDSTLALAIARRGDLPRQYFIKLIETASATVREKLEADDPRAVAAIRDAVDEVAGAMCQEARDASRRHKTAVRDAKRRFRAHAIGEAHVHAPAHAQDFEKTVVALARLGRFPLDLVERALLDQGADMVLILAKAAGCSWTTAKELLRMYSAKREMSPADLAKMSNSFERLSPDMAQHIVNFHTRRVSMRDRAPASQMNSAAPVSLKEAQAAVAVG